MPRGLKCLAACCSLINVNVSIEPACWLVCSANGVGAAQAGRRQDFVTSLLLRIPMHPQQKSDRRRMIGCSRYRWVSSSQRYVQMAQFWAETLPRPSHQPSREPLNFSAVLRCYWLPAHYLECASWEVRVRSTEHEAQSIEVLGTPYSGVSDPHSSTTLNSLLRPVVCSAGRNFMFKCYSAALLVPTTSPHHHSRLLLPASPQAPSILAPELISVWLVELQSHLFFVIILHPLISSVFTAQV